jgi:hypothetical protein
MLGIAAGSAGDDRNAEAEPILEIMSLDVRDCTLALSWPWGGMAVNHVRFNDHSGPFKAVVASSGTGVRVAFDGWTQEPFKASADRVRVVYWVAGRKEIEFVAEAISDGMVRVRPVGRPIAQGKHIVIEFGELATKGVAKVSVETAKD